MTTGLGFLASGYLRRISASDASSEAVDLAQANLALLTEAGLRAREEDLRAVYKEHGKASHYAALESLQRLRALRIQGTLDLRVGAFLANARKAKEVREGLQGEPVDIVFTDVPYDDRCAWFASAFVDDKDHIEGLLDAMLSVTHSRSVIVLMTLKHTDLAHPRLRRIKRHYRGRRSMSILARV
jgi:23S rRNA (guanine2535-N1)-methyltransferase